jgi:DNA replication protein DnaC
MFPSIYLILKYYELKLVTEETKRFLKLRVCNSIFGGNMMTVAAIDRLVRHADIYKIEGDSYRKKQAVKLERKTGQVN